MPRIETQHYRVVHLIIAVFLAAALINDADLEPGVFPAQKHLILIVTGVAALAIHLFVKPAGGLRPLPIPNLTLTQMRVICGVLLFFTIVCLANYYLFEPALLENYKKDLLVVAFVLLGIFLVLYQPSFLEKIGNNQNSE